MSRLRLLVLNLTAAGLLTAGTAALGAETPDAAEALRKMKFAARETAIFVEDMHCASCAKKVTGRLFRLKGVMRVRTNVALDVAVVTPQSRKQLDPVVAWTALQEAGYQPTRLIGPQGTFEPDAKSKLPVKVAVADVQRNAE